MSTLQLQDLDHSRELDRKAMSGIQGGLGDVTVNVPINVTQSINQTQTTSVLNNSIVGATFGSLDLNVNPTQVAANHVAFPGLPH